MNSSTHRTNAKNPQLRGDFPTNRLQNYLCQGVLKRYCARTARLSRNAFCLTATVTVFTVFTVSALAHASTLSPFTTDGCSLFPDRSMDGKKDWCACCLAHDLAYWRGGTEDERLKADQELRACVERKTSDHSLAETMFLGVRTGGGPQINTPFRWGYGWPVGRGYQALTADESALADKLESIYRNQNPGLQCSAPKRGNQ
ncbi:MAG: hypothetical protein KGM99_07465 [Burkholderiales bacterium]|nr:hypothetical protein [Burkholderiales bacterium]